MTPQPRRKDKNEPGNGGQFTTRDNSAPTATLAHAQPSPVLARWPEQLPPPVVSVTLDEWGGVTTEVTSGDVTMQAYHLVGNHDVTVDLLDGGDLDDDLAEEVMDVTRTAHEEAEGHIMGATGRLGNLVVSDAVEAISGARPAKADLDVQQDIEAWGHIEQSARQHRVLSAINLVARAVRQEFPAATHIDIGDGTSGVYVFSGERQLCHVGNQEFRPLLRHVRDDRDAQALKDVTVDGAVALIDIDKALAFAPEPIGNQ